jgi:hypothetical protein
MLEALIRTTLMVGGAVMRGSQAAAVAAAAAALCCRTLCVVAVRLFAAQRSNSGFVSTVAAYIRHSCKQSTATHCVGCFDVLVA